MRLTAEQFLERPPKTLSPLYVIHGAEPLASLEAADCLREVARKTGYVEREVFTAESGFDWGRLTGASNALSLFATQRVIEVRIPTGKPGKEGSAAIEAYCQRLPDDTITLFLLLMRPDSSPASSSTHKHRTGVGYAGYASFPTGTSTYGATHTSSSSHYAYTR